MNRFAPLDYPICLSPPRRIAPSEWCEHIPFGMSLVDLLRPRVLVELGTFFGVSYSAFCQAIAELGLETKAYAVDTWQGDPHNGPNGPDVLADFRGHHDPLYGGFSRAIVSTFDDAREHFADGSIDLLHIDGYHTHEAVKHDFEHWLPKLSERGVVILHDINVRERDFGVWKLWAEVTPKYRTFEFAHQHGLGLVLVGHECPPPLEPLLAATDDDRARIHQFYHQLGHRITLSMRLDAERAHRAADNESVRGELAHRQAMMEKLRAELDERMVSEQSLRAELADSEQCVREHREQLRGRHDREQKMQAELAERERHVQVLRAQSAELLGIADRLATMEQSLSHRIARRMAPPGSILKGSLAAIASLRVAFRRH